MEWSDKEEEALMLCQQRGGGWPQIAALAAELAAARGGTMTAEELAWLAPAQDEPLKTIYQKVLALGARNAVLEADVAKARQSEEVWRKRLEAAAVALGAHGAGQVGRLDIVARVRILLDNTAQSRQREESIRRRSLEAGNLERLIAEHGLPTVMRWVVEGKEPEQSTATHGDYGGELREEHEEIQHYPSSPPCTHPERAKDRGEAFNGDADVCEHRVDRRDTCGDCEYERGEKNGAEAMRAACLKDVREALANVGAWDRETERIVASAIEGATP